MKRIIAETNLIILFALSSLCYSSDILTICVDSEELAKEKTIHSICEYYGLENEKIILDKYEKDIKITEILNNKEFHVIIITAKSFMYFNKEDLLSFLSRKKENKITLLIMEITFDSNFNKQNWIAGESYIKCRNFNNHQVSGFYKFSAKEVINYEFDKPDIKFVFNRLNYFEYDNKSCIKSIIKISNYNSKHAYPIFIKTFLDGQEVFFLARNNHNCEAPKTKGKENNKFISSYGWRRYNSDYVLNVFPLLIFLQNRFGNKCWHSSEHFANFTIDDPWLTESYGHLSYRELCNDIEANFHTTIGFIPWNFDRSKPSVVNLFKRNPHKLSISIHGNNHDHYEFYKYRTDSSDPWPAKPLKAQEANIKQAVARMEKHKELIGIGYDKVMVFPHGIAPEKTLGLLKKFNFLATVNADNVPLGAEKPEDPLFYLRAVTLDYANFPSFRRYSPNRSKFEIALDLFLDNPLLFYAHHDYFKKGMDAFNETAEMVNRIEPDVQWRSLGYIAKHYYLERLRDDGNYDVKAFTNHFIVENPHDSDMTCYIQKEEDFSIPIRQVTVNGNPYSYERADEKLLLTVDIPEGESCEVFIEFENDLDIESIDISKDDPRINKLRKISDFRDITLSQNFLGRFIINVYYDTGLYKWGMKKLIVVFSLIVVLVALSLGGFIYIRRKKKKS